MGWTRAEIMEEGRREGELKLLSILVNKGKLSMEAAAEEFDVTVTKLEELFAGLEKA